MNDCIIRGERIHLINTEIQICKYIAKMRSQCAGEIINNTRAVPNQRMDEREDYIIDLEGIAGEMAWAKLSNTYPDFSISRRSGGRDSTYQGYGIDVKTTRYEMGSLLATLKKVHDHDIDIFVLMIGTLPDFEFGGWAYGEDLLKEENIKDKGRGKGYVLHYDELNDQIGWR